MICPQPSFEHLARMSDEYGTFEHADHTNPRKEHGYCTDDMARLLVVTSREADPSAEAIELARKALRFVAGAQGVRGDCRNRRDRDGRWRGTYGVDDCWGRSLWGLGTAAANSPHDLMRQAALAHFERGAHQRSPWPRAMAFAALGAHEVLAVRPGHRIAIDLLTAAVEVVGDRSSSCSWPWPEPRLSYANAVLPDSMIATGVALGRQVLVDDGLELLAWLLDHETNDGHLSVTPVGGSGPGIHVPTSTSSRSRLPRWRTPALEPLPTTKMNAGRSLSTARWPGSSAITTHTLPCSIPTAVEAMTGSVPTAPTSTKGLSPRSR